MPPYVAGNGTQVYRLATRGKLDACFQRLNDCGADVELIVFTRHCLEVDPKDRPRDTSVLAERITTYLTSVEARLRGAEVDRATAAARAEEALRTAKEHQAAAAAERRARRLQLGLAVVILCATTIGGFSAVWTAVVQSQLRKEAELAERTANSAREAESKQLARAEREKARAESQQQLAESEKKRSNSMLADMQTERGLQAARNGQPAEAALWFAQASTLTPHDLDRQQANLLRAHSWMKSATIPVARLGMSFGDAQRFNFQPNGPLLFASNEASFRVWDWRNEVTLQWSETHSGVTDADWSPDGRRLAVGFNTGDVRLFESMSGKELGSCRHPERVAIIRWSPDGTRLAIGSAKLQVWSVAEEPKLELDAQHPAMIYGINFNRQGTRLVTASTDDLARIFAVGTPGSTVPVLPPIEHLPGERNINSVPVFCDTDQRLVTIRRNARTPQMWDVSTGQQITAD